MPDRRVPCPTRVLGQASVIVRKTKRDANETVLEFIRKEGFVNNIIKMLCTAAVLVAIASCADAIGRQTYPCHRLAQAPALDGKLDDEAWKNIPEATGFFIFRSGGSEKYAAEKQTSFKAGWTADALYIAVRAEESTSEKMIATVKDNIWMENNMEVFLFPPGAPTYVQLVASSAGSRWNGRGVEVADVMGWEAKAVVGQTEWCLELRIPFAVLMAPSPKEGDEWPVNVARNILTGPAEERFTCWPLLQTGFHDVKNFGHFVFKGAAVAKAIDEEKEINRAYFRDVHARIKKLAGMAEKYDQALGEAQKTEDQRIAAENLMQLWGQIVKLAAQPEPDYVELESVRRNCIGLPQRSEDCIARGILEMLFKE